ncbi:MAG: hypothetical protein ACR2II_01035 [Chthoniobacterales bacterium]
MGIALGAAAGAALCYFGARYALQFFVWVSGAKWLNLLPVLALPVLWVIAVGLGGGTFMLWLVGPLMLRRTPAGVRAGWNRSVNLSGGMAVCVPLDPARVTPTRLAVMIGGGPLAVC